MNNREINTKAFVERTRDSIKKRVDKVKSKGKSPKLTVIKVGDDQASNKYVANKVELGKKLGIEVEVIKFGDRCSYTAIVGAILDCSNPVIVQCPLPPHLDIDVISSYIPHEFDVDGFSLVQKGALANGNERALVPATALGVYELLKEECGDLRGKSVCIVNRSHLIGKPLSQLLTNANATVTLCHSHTENLMSHMRLADIIITGCGKRAIFNHRWIGSGAIIIDCSMAKKEGIQGVGDFDKESILDDEFSFHSDVRIASGYGHTGLLTTTFLMNNVIMCYEED